MDFTKSLVNLAAVSEQLKTSRAKAAADGIPVTDDESLQLLTVLLSALRPKKILEIGTGTGLSGVAMLQLCPNATLTTVEVDEARFFAAKENFFAFSVSNRVNAVLCDAGEFLAMTDGEFDFIFLDGPKAQYLNYLPDLKRLLTKGGVLFTDDVLLYGWVSGEAETPKKRRSIIDKIRSFLDAITDDSALLTSVLNVGEGVAVSVKR